MSTAEKRIPREARREQGCRHVQPERTGKQAPAERSETPEAGFAGRLQLTCAVEDTGFAFRGPSCPASFSKASLAGDATKTVRHRALWQRNQSQLLGRDGPF